MIIKSYINRGNSFPVILEDKGKKYFVKLRAGMSGKYALIAEWIGNKLGNQLNIKTQFPNWIELGSDIKVDNIYIEVKELVGKSLGTNIGFEYQEEAKELKKNELSLLSKKEANEIFLFDLMMINIDRTASNLNLMKVGNEVISVDYESSLLYQELMEHKNLLKDNRILQCLKNSPLYEEISEIVVDDFLRRTEMLSIKGIIAEIPMNLLSKEERNSLIQGIKEKNRNKWFLTETMGKLKGLQTETKEEQKRRIKKNQEDFRRKFKDNSVS